MSFLSKIFKYGTFGLASALGKWLRGPKLPDPVVAPPVAAPAAADPISIAANAPTTEDALTTLKFPFSSRRRAMLASASNSTLGSTGTLY